MKILPLPYIWNLSNIAAKLDFFLESRHFVAWFLSGLRYGLNPCSGQVFFLIKLPQIARGV